VTLWNARDVRHIRLEERQRDLQNVSETAFSVIKEYGLLAQLGKMTVEEAKTQAAARLKAMRYGKDGYFVVQHDAVLVMHPTNSALIGKDMSGLMDANGEHVFEKALQIGKQGGGFVDYMWPKPGSETPQPKKSYVLYYQPWEWCVVTGVYVDDIDAAYHASLAKSLGLLLGVGLLMTLAAAVLTRGMYRQLGGDPSYAADIAGRIAAGDLSGKVEIRGEDRDSMLFAMAQMQHQLTLTISDIKTSAESIATSSKQIAIGNSDLSQRTEEQASSLEETASSMEELRSIVRQNASHARQASDLTVGASSIALRGGEVVGRVIETMSGIQISSSKISSIVGVIEGIAFQTNILALNAAVEAARAGQEGRGFAVVAGEVRALALRSAAASKEIKQLIDDSVNRVRDGTELVEEAGTVMEEVVLAVKRITELVREISNASEEQCLGIEQVNQAVVQIDSATQQNAALVEQASAAAHSLEEQARKLRDVVSVFELAQQ